MEARKILSVNIALTQSARSLPYLFDMTIKYDQGNDTILESLYAIELVKQVKEKYKPYLDKQSEDIFIRFEELTTRTYTNTVASPCFFSSSGSGIGPGATNEATWRPSGALDTGRAGIWRK